METFEIVRRINQWASLSALAQQAQYGLEYVSRGNFDSATADYLKSGIILCTVLKEGAIAWQSDKIKPEQLDNFQLFEPVGKDFENVEQFPDTADSVREVLQEVIEKEGEVQVEASQLQELKSFFRKIDQSFLDSASSDVEFLHSIDEF